jgi:type II secretory ATPase GspE/PulE/Tfp pilus assembly ATPase PilB-like protein
MHSALVARVKILANLKIDEHRIPQDGRFKFDSKGQTVALRVSIIPAFRGENIVLRLLEESARPMSLTELGLLGRNKEVIENVIKQPNGMVLATGPTGSGKTTTLYSILNILNTPEIKICTIEDPIEYEISRVNQTQVNPKIGLTFAKGLRSLLRHDPDNMMVGEIRDKETAEIAIHSALTGHLVLSTLHTNSAPAAVPRLLDMGVEPYLVSSTLNVIIAQRLVRSLCQNCIEEFKPKRKVIDQIISSLDDKQKNLIKGKKFYRSRGCQRCNNTGYKGRLGIYEVLTNTNKIADLILETASDEKIEEAAKKEGFESMFVDGLNKAVAGKTTLEEVLRVVKLEKV